jgi:PAS domain S-box-containing protein
MFRVGSLVGLSGFVWFGFRKIVRDRVDRQVERVRQQAALSEVQARLALVLENTSDVVSFATPQGNLLFLNRAGRKLLGVREGIPVTHYRLGDLHSKDARPRIEVEALKEAIETGSWQGETALQNSNGPDIPVSLLILSHHHADGSIDFISTIARDISEARRAEEARTGLEKQLRAAQKMEALGTLAGGIAHDFNNILTGILGNAELLRVTLTEDASTQQQIASIIRASGRARDLIRQMLAFGRPQESRRAPILIWPVVEEAAVLLRASIPASIEIISDCKAPSAVALADPVQIHQVIMNLGANAAHAMAEKDGILTIRQEVVELREEDLDAKDQLRPGKWIKVSISDTGHGMTPEIQERIFEPFFTTKATGQGTGLGLSVVHGILRSHGGAVIVRSAPDAGSTFELYFPLIENARPVASEPRAEIPQGHGERLLLVDDEEIVLMVAAKTVNQLGYQCVTFTDPVEALIYFQAKGRDLDLLLTDLSMPRLSGAALATAIREIRPDFPVIISTGFSGRLKPGEAEKAGARAILSKPYQMHELAQALRRSLEKK